MLYKVVHLSSGFMLTSLVGAIISVFYVYPKSRSFGFAFLLFFVLMLVAALISMAYAPIESHFDVKKERKKII
ncbi:hypothetical protein J4401_02170 [Candidatus Woesearchaeota archaeon]|nr:hypothetical protein [Candidatus Woesearchaeota archaeon]